MIDDTVNARTSPLEVAADLVLGPGKYSYKGGPGQGQIDFTSPHGGDRWSLRLSGEQLSLRWNDQFEYVTFINEEPAEQYEAAGEILRNAERVWNGAATMTAAKTWPLRRLKFELETRDGEFLQFYQLR